MRLEALEIGKACEERTLSGAKKAVVSLSQVRRRPWLSVTITTTTRELKAQELGDRPMEWYNEMVQ